MQMWVLQTWIKAQGLAILMISAFLLRYIQVFINKCWWMGGEYIDSLAKDCGHLVQQWNYPSIALSHWYVLSDTQKQKTKLDLP